MARQSSTTDQPNNPAAPRTGRRGAVGLALMAPVFAWASAAPARADTRTAPDAAVSCDLELVPVLRALAASFRARSFAPIHVFTAPPPLQIAQIERQTQTDLLVTRLDAIHEATAHGLTPGGTRETGWTNRLVFATRAGIQSPASAEADALKGFVGGARVAVPDPTVAATFDGAAVLRAAGLSDALGPRVQGVADTREVAFLLRDGTARLGLLYATETREGSGLRAVAPVPDAAFAPVAYAAAIVKTSESPSARGFLDFILSAEGAAMARASGLEIAS